MLLDFSFVFFLFVFAVEVVDGPFFLDIQGVLGFFTEFFMVCQGGGIVAEGFIGF